MTDQPSMPDPEKVKQTVANLRKTRLEMEESRLELEEITAKLEHDMRQQRLKRIRRSLDNMTAETQEITS
jgi:hypothetical protein